MTVERLTRLEERFDAFQARAEREFSVMSRLHQDNKVLMARLDERLDKVDVFHARLLATFAAVIVAANFLAPIVLHMLNIVP